MVKSRTLTYIVLVTVFTLAAILAIAENVPLGATDVQEGFDQSVNNSNYPAFYHDAIAGNITEINITGFSQTKHWQGYWGEVTGTLTLDDADNWTLYTWPVTEPEGEVYATVNNTPDWSTVHCFNFSDQFSGPGSLTWWETYYNMTYFTEDGINETFTSQNHQAFAVGDVSIASGTCPNTYTYVQDQAQSLDFVEVLLRDVDGRLIFSTVIENDDAANNTDPVGYNNQRHDFQMLVAEDGTSYSAPDVRNVDTTRYYFYLDIE